MRQKTALKETVFEDRRKTEFVQQKPNTPLAVQQGASSWYHVWKSPVRRSLCLTGVLSLKEISCHADAIYSNVINLDPWKEDDFAVYGNVPPFDRPRKTSPDRVEYASIVFR